MLLGNEYAHLYLKEKGLLTEFDALCTFNTYNSFAVGTFFFLEFKIINLEKEDSIPSQYSDST